MYKYIFIICNDILLVWTLIQIFYLTEMECVISIKKKNYKE